MEKISSAGLTRQELRKVLRLRRNNLSEETQAQAAVRLSRELTALPEWQQATHVAAYLANDGEVSLSDTITTAAAQNKIVSLPVLHPFNRQHLLFLHYHDNTILVNNRFNIAEPQLRCTDVIPFSRHDLILMPLTGFDEKGNRLGMGGGFYDRTLAPYRNAASRPLLAGIAHDCQQVDALPVEPWDFPLDLIITPSGVIRPDKTNCP